MITAENLKQIAELKDLPENQVKALVELSKNLTDKAFDISDKNSRGYKTFKPMIDEQIKTTHGKYDEIIKKATGLDKPMDKKTYENLEAILTDAWKAKTEIEPLQTKIAELEEKVKDGKIDDALKAQYEKKITDLNGEIAALKKVTTDSKAEHEKALADLQAKLDSTHLSAQLDKVEAGLTFNDTISEDLRKMAIENARLKMSGITQETVDGADGKVVVLRNADGQILRDSAAKPFTQAGYYTHLLGSIIDIKKMQSGGGGGDDANSGGSGGGKTLDLSTAKSQMQASKMTSDFIMSKGIAEGTMEFAEMQNTIYDENREAGVDITTLPMREPAS